MSVPPQSKTEFVHPCTLYVNDVQSSDCHCELKYDNVLKCIDVKMLLSYSSALFFKHAFYVFFTNLNVQKILRRLLSHRNGKKIKDGHRESQSSQSNNVCLCGTLNTSLWRTRVKHCEQPLHTFARKKGSTSRYFS